MRCFQERCLIGQVARGLMAGLWLVLGLATCLPSPPAAAQQMQDFDLRSASFQLPDGWVVIAASRDQSYNFASPDGRFHLSAGWWFPDQPLPGYDDEISHTTRMLAGQEALFIHSENPNGRVLQLAFPQTDDEGKQFLWQLITVADQVPLSEHQALFETLLAGLAVNGVPALGTHQTPDPAVPTPPPPEGGGRFSDSAGAFSLPLPAGWSGYSAEAAGLRQVVLLSPARDALVLAAVAAPDGDRSAAQVIEDFITLLYRDVLVMKSVENEAFPMIAGQPGHAVETISNIYAINGISLPFVRGRVRVYQVPQADPPFVLVTVRGLNASAELAATLDATATGFAADASAASAIAAAAAVPVAIASDETAARPGAPTVLFDGQSLQDLHALAFNEADFATDARLGQGGLAINFAEKRGAAKAGLAAVDHPLALPGPDTALYLLARIDGAQTSALTLALVPPDHAMEDPAKTHALQLRLVHLGDGKGHAVLSVAGGAGVSEAKFAWPAGPASFVVTIRPDRVVELRDDAGVQLAELTFAADPGPGPVVLQALLPVDPKNQPASLVLQGLESAVLPYSLPPDPSGLVTGPVDQVTVFDGLSFGRIWAGNARGDGQFRRFARLDDGALRIGWEPEDKGSYVGIVSPDPVLWLDGLRGRGEARLTVEIDPAATGDFEISLAPTYTLPGNLTDNSSYVLSFIRQPDGTFSATSAMRNTPKRGIRTDGLATLPRLVTLVLRDGQVHVLAKGVSHAVLPLPAAADAAGLRVAVHALPDAQGRGALVLHRISRSQTPDTEAEAPRPAPGVDPLARTVVFDGQLSTGWLGQSSGDALASERIRQDPEGLTLVRPAPAANDHRVALVGTEVIADLGEPILTTPFDITLDLAPTSGLATRVFLYDNPEANYEKGAIAAVTLREVTTGAGGLEVRLHTGHFSYDHWRRVLSAEQVRKIWDGRLRVLLGDGWIAVAIGDTVVMRGSTAVVGRGNRFLLAVQPGGLGRATPGQVTLRRITTGWVSPPGMTASQRLQLGPLAEFDPVAYLDHLARETGD